METNIEDLSKQYRLGCYSEKNPESCHLLGEYFEKIKEDFQKASNIYQSNCDASSFGRSCHTFANHSFVGKGIKEDLPQALKYYEKGCTAGNVDSCLYGGIMCVSTSNSTKAVSKDYTKGLDLLEKACSNENAFACHYISGMYSVGIEGFMKQCFNKSFDFALKACDRGNMYACSNVALMYKKGEGVEPDQKKSEEYRSKFMELHADALAKQPSPHPKMPT